VTGAPPAERLAEVGLLAIGLVGHEVAIFIPATWKGTILAALGP
jgi:hypothetical protein